MKYMSIVNAKEIMMVAAKEKYAVGAFNITDLVQMEAVVEAAVAKKAPLIIQTSVKPTKFLGVNVLVAIYRTLAERLPSRSACTWIIAPRSITARSVRMAVTPIS
jgi:fructose-bisphosphate aldolase class II